MNTSHMREYFLDLKCNSDRERLSFVDNNLFGGRCIVKKHIHSNRQDPRITFNYNEKVSGSLLTEKKNDFAKNKFMK